MAVLAGVIAIEVLTALVAEIDVAAQSRGAAVLDITHGRQMGGGHPVAKLRTILRAMQPEYVGYFSHQGQPVVTDQ
jgi:hypothetical protein